MDPPVSDCHPAYVPCLPNAAGNAYDCGDLDASLKPVTVVNVEFDPSEEFPLNPGGSAVPGDPAAAAALAAIVKAYEHEVATFVSRAPQESTTCGAPGQYGVCCDRAKNCDCDGPPTSSYAL